MAGMASPCNAQEVVLQLQSDRQSKPTMEKSLLKSSMLSSGLSQIDPEMATISQEIDNMRTGAAKMAHAMQEKIRQIIAKNCMYAEADNRLQTNVRVESNGSKPCKHLHSSMLGLRSLSVALLLGQSVQSPELASRYCGASQNPHVNVSVLVTDFNNCKLNTNRMKFVAHRIYSHYTNSNMVENFQCSYSLSE